MSAAPGALRILELAAAHWNRELGAHLSSLDQALAEPAGGAVRPAAEALSARLHLLDAATFACPVLGRDDIAAFGVGLSDPITVDTAGLDAAETFQPAVGRVLLNLLLLAAESLPSGGTVRLAGSATELFVQIAGPDAAWPDGTALCLVDPDAAAGALQKGRLPRAALASVLAHEAGIRLSTLMTPHASVPPILRLSTN